VSEERRFERYEINQTDGKKANVEIIIEGRQVHLVDFSIGGLYALAEKPFSKDEVVKLSINLENKGKIDLMGKVIRSKLEPNSKLWGIAIDILHTYNVKPVPKT